MGSSGAPGREEGSREAPATIRGWRGGEKQGREEGLARVGLRHRAGVSEGRVLCDRLGRRRSRVARTHGARGGHGRHARLGHRQNHANGMPERVPSGIRRSWSLCFTKWGVQVFVVCRNGSSTTFLLIVCRNSKVENGRFLNIQND